MRGILRTTGLFMLMLLLFTAVGWAVGAYFGSTITGMVFFLGIAAIMNVIAYFFSDKIVLATYRAKIVSEAQAPNLHRIVRRVAQRFNLPMPRVAVVPTQTPNAFATGRNPSKAVVAVTEGIMQLLDESELEGVLAHEMGHIKDRDILVMSVAATLAGAISFAARALWWSTIFGRGRRDINPILLIIVMVTAPLAALLIHLAISRSREYKADYVGAKAIGRPNALANALEKLEGWNRRRPLDFGSPTSASLFIVNPFRRSGFSRLFATHPPVEKRVARLRRMAMEMGSY
jgi:heat shock protein HtpX